MNYKITGNVGLSKIPTDRLIKIIRSMQDSILSVIRAQFPEESRGFKVFINNFTHDSLGLEIGSNKPATLKKGLDHIDKAISEDISQLPDKSYKALKNLREIAIEMGGSFGVYNEDTSTPLFELTPEKAMPEPPPNISLVEEKLSAIGKILEFTGVGETTTIHIRLLDNQDIYLKVPRAKAMELRKWLYEYVDIFGTVQRETGCYKFKNFAVESLKLEPNGEQIRKTFEKMKRHLPKKTGESVDLEEFEREWFAV